jgi:hypothetical protein
MNWIGEHASSFSQDRSAALSFGAVVTRLLRARTGFPSISVLTLDLALRALIAGEEGAVDAGNGNCNGIETTFAGTFAAAFAFGVAGTFAAAFGVAVGCAAAAASGKYCCTRS